MNADRMEKLIKVAENYTSCCYHVLENGEFCPYVKLAHSETEDGLIDHAHMSLADLLREVAGMREVEECDHDWEIVHDKNDPDVIGEITYARCRVCGREDYAVTQAEVAEYLGKQVALTPQDERALAAIRAELFRRIERQKEEK